MNSGWEITTVGAVTQVGAGNSAPQGDHFFSDGYHPFFRTSDVGRVKFGKVYESADYLNDEGIKGLRRFPKGTILFPKSGASTFLNHRVMLGVDGFVSSHLATIVGDERKVNRQFLMYFLSTIIAQELIQDHAYPSLNLPVIAGIPLLLPTLPEQQRIVAILDETFEGIAIAAANSKKNLNNARELFHNTVQAVFSAKNDGWEEKTLNQIAENLDSKRVPITKSVRSNGSYPYYGASGIVDYVDEFIFDGDLLLVSEDGANLLARTYPIAFSISGKTWVNNHAHVLRFKEMATQRLVEFYLNSIPLDDYVSGMAQPKLNQKMLNTIVVPYPPLTQQHVIVEKLLALSTETKKLEAIYQQKLVALDALKKSILGQAFSGQLHIKAKAAA